MVSSVGLVKALGGGWELAQMDRETGAAAVSAQPAASAAAALGSTNAAAANAPAVRAHAAAVAPAATRD